MSMLKRTVWPAGMCGNRPALASVISHALLTPRMRAITAAVTGASNSLSDTMPTIYDENSGVWGTGDVFLRELSGMD